MIATKIPQCQRTQKQYERQNGWYQIFFHHLYYILVICLKEISLYCEVAVPPAVPPVALAKGGSLGEVAVPSVALA
jgi:hypothetical protein